MSHLIRSAALSAVLLVSAIHCANAARITTPKEQFGFHIGDDYSLATFRQLTAYWKKLAAESDRMKLVEIGKTAEGRSQWMAILTSPENHKRLDRYRDIARRLALAEGLSDAEARKLAAEGKAIVWIDGGLHATETLGAQQLIELVFQFASRSDPETLRILNDVIILAVHANPDGHDLVADSYMKEQEPTRRAVRIPRLYQKYIGHDNNRDLFMANMPESTNMARVLFREWFPQIMYNHHQSGPTGTVLFAPPFRDPYSYYFDPLIRVGLNLVGAAMHSRFVAEGKPGATLLEGAAYSNWFNGGLRSTTCYHNMIGILTETIGSPTPMEIPFVPGRLLSSKTLPYPIQPQKWHFRQSVEYSLTANRAILDIASRYREVFLENIYRMGRNSIERGNRDTWTITPKRIAGVKSYVQLRDPMLRDARGYIIPANQPDFLTATKFVNALIKNGVTVHRASAAFDVAGKRYVAGSYVVRAAQAFRPHVLDMFEPQDYPNDFQYPGGPPIPPYDNSGWTLAYQMGIEFDRVLDGFDGPFTKVGDVLAPPRGLVSGATDPAGYSFSHAVNDSFVAVNRLLKNGDTVYWLNDGVGTMYVPGGRRETRPVIEKLAAETGVSFRGAAAQQTGDAYQLRPVRIGLWDRYGGSMPSGWTRWIFEQYEFPFRLVFPQELDAGELVSKFDVLVFVTDAIPARDAAGESNSVTVEKTVPKLKEFLEAGGTILAIGTSTSLARHLGLPLTNALVEAGDRPLPREKFYIPGSVLSLRVDNTHPLAWGMRDRADFFYLNSPAFRLRPGAAGVKPVAWFDSREPLRSGWAWGQQYLEGAAGVLEAQVGAGKLILYGPEVTFRAQPHGTFKLFFNGIYYGTAKKARL